MGGMGGGMGGGMSMGMNPMMMGMNPMMMGMGADGMVSWTRLGVEANLDPSALPASVMTAAPRMLAVA